LEAAVGALARALVVVEEECCVLAVLELTVVDLLAAASSCALAAALKTHPSNKATTAGKHAFRIPTGVIISTQIGFISNQEKSPTEGWYWVRLRAQYQFPMGDLGYGSVPARKMVPS
jgi:hypothetical protein